MNDYDEVKAEIRECSLGVLRWGSFEGMQVAMEAGSRFVLVVMTRQALGPD
jgi:hypothetical protein